MGLDLAAIELALKEYRDAHVACDGAGCYLGYVAPDPNDIDSYTLKPRTAHCPVCAGKGMLPKQRMLL